MVIVLRMVCNGCPDGPCLTAQWVLSEKQKSMNGPFTRPSDYKTLAAMASAKDKPSGAR
jgi:hypothetical protein